MECVVALHQWKLPGFLIQVVTMGPVSTMKVITTDAPLQGWGATHEGRIVNGVWAPHLQFTDINSLELLAVSLALRHFLPSAPCSFP